MSSETQHPYNIHCGCRTCYETGRRLASEAQRQDDMKAVQVSIDAQSLVNIAKVPVGELTGINPKDRVGATKPPLSLVPPVALVHCAMAMRNGAEKYGAYNWRTEKVQSMIYLDAAMRHIADFIDGEELAEDSKVHHLAHAMACCAILLDAFEGGFVKDNRPPKGPAPAAIARLTLTK